MNATVDEQRIQSALKKVSGALLSEIGSRDHWTGELSSSALSTAVAVIALYRMGAREFAPPGLRWLAAHANTDGGWGDTVRSPSNLSTTALCWAAFGATGRDEQFAAVVQGAERWLWRTAGSRDRLREEIVARYGKDRTFSIPILMTLALSGRLGPDGWRLVPPLPFELAAFPRSWFGALQLPVVSYALPALIAIGQTIHHHAPSRNPFARFTRNLVRDRTLTNLDRLQPRNGGFLEATPLTAFVTMSLAGMDRQDHPVARRGASFLKTSMRPDGSWPIDTNLATWMTTLSVKALARQPGAVTTEQRIVIRQWLLDQQFQTEHPYTGAAPGGWAWTNLPGGVPDADDTAAALLTLAELGDPDEKTIRAAELGLTWLLDLQNRDGGIPTFCRGWGALPFDRSAPELTAHAMHAWVRWQKVVHPNLARRIARALSRAQRFLAATQREDGAWVPLWFGNENAASQENPVYGTARTLIELNEAEALGYATDNSLRVRAADFLRASQRPTGGWGGDSLCPESIEETALAVEALAGAVSDSELPARGVDRLLELTEVEAWRTPAPIGLYFARLWYFERLYPLIFATSALSRISHNMQQRSAAVSKISRSSFTQ